MRRVAVLTLLLTIGVAFGAQSAASSPLHLIFGVDRGTRRHATAQDELVKVQVTARASDRSYECSESRDEGSIECTFDTDALGAPGEYSIRVVHPPKGAGPKWTTNFTVPDHALSIELSGAVTLAGDRSGLGLGWARVLVPADPLVVLEHDGPTPSLGATGASTLPILFKVRNRSEHGVNVETVGEKPMGQLFKVGDDGVSRRHVGPLDACFEPRTEYAMRLRPGADVIVSDRSSREPLTPGRYVFVVKYSPNNSRPLVVGRGDRPNAEARYSFEVK